MASARRIRGAYRTRANQSQTNAIAFGFVSNFTWFTAFQTTMSEPIQAV
jgi:hypothetical protein